MAHSTFTKWLLAPVVALAATSVSSAQAQAFSIRQIAMPVDKSARPTMCTLAMAQIVKKLGWKVLSAQENGETGTLLSQARNGVLVTAFCSSQSRHIYLSAVNPNRNDNSPEIALNELINRR